MHQWKAHKLLLTFESWDAAAEIQHFNSEHNVNKFVLILNKKEKT